jgi:hypothetical protein
MRTQLAFAAAVMLVGRTARADETSATPTERPAGPLTVGAGISTMALFVPVFGVVHLGYDLADVASVNIYVSAGRNLLGDSSMWLRPGLQFRLFPVGDPQNGMFLGPEARLWGASTGSLLQLGGRVGARAATSLGFTIDASFAAFHTLETLGERDSDALDVVIALSSLTLDVWLAWRF